MSMIWIDGSTVSGSSTNAITFSNIPQTYTHLQLITFIRTLTNATTEAVYLYNFNNNTGNTGSMTHYFTGDGSTMYTGANLTQYSSFAGTYPANNATSSVYGAGVLDILDYSNTTKNKTIRGFAGHDRNGAGEVNLVSNLPLTLPGTGAITTLSVALTGGNYFREGSRFDLYGIPSSTATGA